MLFISYILHTIKLELYWLECFIPYINLEGYVCKCIIAFANTHCLTLRVTWASYSSIFLVSLEYTLALRRRERFTC